MNRLFKTFLIALLALTLPVHVMAASLMPMMPAIHVEKAMSARVEPASVATPVHAHMHHDGMDMTVRIAPPDPAVGHQGHDMKHCPSCGACCMSAVLVRLDVLPGLHPQGLAAMPFFNAYLPSPAPHRLDRPPRPALV